MKVALLDCDDYRQKNDQGLLDLDRTLDMLRRAEFLMDAALGSSYFFCHQPPLVTEVA